MKLATDRQNTLHPTTKGKIKYVNYFVTNDSGNDIKHKLYQEYPVLASAGIIGLHACADLSITTLKLFLDIDIAKCLVIMPCCYHRLQMSSESDGECETFVNFPISAVLKELYIEFNGQRFLRRYFLRLACQQSSSKIWDLSSSDRELLVKNCLYRAILQKVAEEGKYHLFCPFMYPLYFCVLNTHMLKIFMIFIEHSLNQKMARYLSIFTKRLFLS